MSLKLRVKVGPKTLAATLEDNPATAGFRQMLPLTLDMPDLNANEKRARLPERLSTDPIKPGTDAERTQGRKNASGARRAGGADRTQPFPLPWVPLSTGGGACLASAF